MKVLKQTILLIGLAACGASALAADPVAASPADPAMSVAAPAAADAVAAAPATTTNAAANAAFSTGGDPEVCNPTRPAVVGIGKPHPRVHKFKPRKHGALKGAICH